MTNACIPAWALFVAFILLFLLTFLLFIFASDKASVGLRWGGLTAVIVGFVVFGIVMWFGTGSKRCQTTGLTCDLNTIELENCQREVKRTEDMNAQLVPIAVALQRAQREANNSNVRVPLTLDFGTSLDKVQAYVLPDNVVTVPTTIAETTALNINLNQARQPQLVTEI